MNKVDNRYMFDTNALNRICKSFSDEAAIYLSKSSGYEYYFTEIQTDESADNIKRSTPGVSKELVERERAEFALQLVKLIGKLQTRYVGQIAILRPNRWILDGTYQLLSDEDTAVHNMFLDILNDNDFQYYNDGMIAMTAIANGCTLVTDDRRLFNKVNKHFPGRAIRYADFRKLLPR